MAMKFKIIGAGMSGLLAACMLREKCIEVSDKATFLPNNHHAVLRFRSSVVGDATGIPFRKVSVISSVDESRNPISDALSYSRKTNGKYLLRSIASGTNEIKERYIAPPNFTKALYERVCNQSSTKFVWGMDAAARDNRKAYLRPPENTGIISTIPMPNLMHIVGWEEEPDFKYSQIAVIKAQFNHCDAHATMYYPHHDLISRASLTGNELAIEIPIGDGRDQAAMEQMLQTVHDESGSLLQDVMRDFGLRRDDFANSVVAVQKYGKIAPIDDAMRKRFIMHMSEQYGIYSLGRYATWRPGLLVDDLVNDVRVIERLSSGSTNYSHKI
jgi:hypothetical protein